MYQVEFKMFDFALRFSPVAFTLFGKEIYWYGIIVTLGIVLGVSFQALGNGIYSTITSLCRQLVVLLPAAYLLSLTGDVHAVWWSFPIAEVVSLLITLFLYGKVYHNKIKPMFAEN